MDNLSGLRHWMAIGLLLCAALTALPSAHADGVTTFDWNAPADASGPGVVSLSLDFGTSNACEVTGEGTGTGSLGPVGWIRIGGSWAMLSFGSNAQVHANDAGIDTRTLSSSGNWGMRATFGGTFSGTQEVSVAVTDMNGWLATGDDPWYPARIAFTCDDPVTVLGASGSHQVLAFSDVSMEGTGASATVILADAKLNVDDSVAATFDTEDVEVVIMDWAFQGPNYREYTLETPSETNTSTSLSLGHAATYYDRDGPGDYRFSLTQVGAGIVISLSGWFIGYDPVASLDDLFA